MLLVPKCSIYYNVYYNLYNILIEFKNQNTEITRIVCIIQYIYIDELST